MKKRALWHKAQVKLQNYRWSDTAGANAGLDLPSPKIDQKRALRHKAQVKTAQLPSVRYGRCKYWSGLTISKGSMQKGAILAQGWDHPTM